MSILIISSAAAFSVSLVLTVIFGYTLGRRSGYINISTPMLCDIGGFGGPSYYLFVFGFTMAAVSLSAMSLGFYLATDNIALLVSGIATALLFICIAIIDMDRWPVYHQGVTSFLIAGADTFMVTTNLEIKIPEPIRVAAWILTSWIILGNILVILMINRAKMHNRNNNSSKVKKLLRTASVLQFSCLSALVSYLLMIGISF